MFIPGMRNVGSLRLLRLVKELSSVSTDMRVSGGPCDSRWRVVKRAVGRRGVLSRCNGAAAPAPSIAWLVRQRASPSTPPYRCLRRFILLLSPRAGVGGRWLQIIASSIFTSLPALGNVLVLALVFCTCFSLVGMELWAGVMSGVCGYTDTGTGERVLLEAMPCALPCSAFDDGGNARCTPTYGDACPASMSVTVTLVPANASAGTDAVMGTATLPLACMRGANPDAGMTHFDNYGNAVSARTAAVAGWLRPALRQPADMLRDDLLPLLTSCCCSC